jgi:hypothetical protein
MKTSSAHTLGALGQLLPTKRRRLSGAVARLTLVTVALIAAGGTVATVLARGGGGGQVKVPTTNADFLQPGTQPEPDPNIFAPIETSISCTFCHSGYGDQVAPYDTWATSLMAQSARDPVWHAAVTIANQDANIGGETCMRCHAPNAWLGGRSVNGNPADLQGDDFDGINCNFCHRVVNPELGPNSAIAYPGDPANPDNGIISALAAQGLIPQGAGNARYVVDPASNRRGPFDDVPANLHGVDAKLITSPFHRMSEFCGVCHDVSNPIYSKNRKTGEYALNALGQPHPTQNPADMFPEQRTYSEWLNSAFVNGVQYADHRFGGNDADGVVSTCQDCHMPKVIAGGCVFYEYGPPFFARTDMPQHSFAGANTWVVQAIRNMMLPEDADSIGLTQPAIDAATTRTIQMLQNASDMTLSQEGNYLKVRITNESGHKLPTGYPEGRRMWINVKFTDLQGQQIAERGAYDNATATLSAGDSKIYEAKHGISPAIAKLTGLTAGPAFHLALANKVFKDNRIPPRGFTNAAYNAIGSAPVGYAYADGQHWDDTYYQLPTGAHSAVVTVYYQTTSKEYIEFLRDANVTNTTGIDAYNAWVNSGKSAPVAMDSASIALTPANPADINGDGVVNGNDLAILLSNWGGSGAGDIDGSGTVNGSDLAILLSSWG